MKTRMIHLAATVALLFCLTATFCGGCRAPAEVTVAQATKARALGMYLRNDARLDGVMTSMWKSARDKQVDAKVAEVAAEIVKVKGKPVAGGGVTITGEQALELAAAAIVEKRKADAGTDRILAAMKALRDKNVADTLTPYRELEGALNKYLSAGVDAAVLDQMTQYLVTAIEAAGRETP